MSTASESYAMNIELVIDYGNTTQTAFSNLVASTAFDVLNQSASVTYIQYAYGKFVISINGVANNDNNNGFFWQYWVNDILAPVAADNYILTNGDHVLWRYSAPEEIPNPPPTLNPDLLIGLTAIGAVGGITAIALILIFYKRR